MREEIRNSQVYGAKEIYEMWRYTSPETLMIIAIFANTTCLRLQHYVVILEKSLARLQQLGVRGARE